VIFAARQAPLPRAIPAAIALAWALAIAAQVSGEASLLHHDALIEGGPPFWVALALFVVAWQVMLAAMMLPSTLPLLRLFIATAGRGDGAVPSRILGAFLGGYALVWSTFGAAAFVLDLGVHRTVDATPWLASRSWLIGGATLAFAGLFQFSSLKDRCLDKCRHPAGYLMQHYGRGPRAAFRLGRGHGMHCLGCCLALMLVMFGVGIANLWWMAALTAVVVHEKTGAGGRRAVPVTGVVLLALGALVLAHPAWLPPMLGAS